ncbi:MAG: fluoride efflux transporter CrcB [Actinomycetaceae bacterium]|nr:fluoride efflux transporter CrcB [Arcanobacterium sp.]MDD7686834.1 fluoride efflux transporter CrcB [Actinomycetaceae bacterium]MDY5273583.1 fluoride efflux transporter CrcB [Arcanobacterium sp.]
MNIFTVLFIGIGGGLGAALRYGIDSRFRDGETPAHSWRLGTLLVNLLGSFVLGVVTAIWAGEGAEAQWLAIIGTGFCGGLTTFSSASLDTVELAQEKSRLHASSYQAFMLLGCLLLAILGFTIGRAFSPYSSVL